MSNRRANPVPSLLGKVARSAGWGVANCFGPRRIARPPRQTFIDPYLLSALHPPPRGTFPASRRKGTRRPPAGSLTCVNAVGPQQGAREAPHSQSDVAAPPSSYPLIRRAPGGRAG